MGGVAREIPAGIRASFWRRDHKTLNTIISLSFTQTLLVALVFSAVLIVGSLLMLRVFNARTVETPLGVPLPPFIAAIATAWALSLGFVAADIWTVNARAENWASQERSAIVRLAGMARADALDSQPLMEALRDYTTASSEHEWKALANSRPAPEVDEALQRIRLEIIGTAFADLPPPLVTKLIRDFDLLQEARDMRLGIGARSINTYKWYLVFALTFLSLVTIAVTHADRPAAGRNAIVIFTGAAAVSLWILVLHANPYLGVEGILPEEVNTFPYPAAASS